MESIKPPLQTLSDRLRQVLELTGTRKIDLARAIDVKPQVIQFLCSSNTKASRFTFEIATALGLNTRWLATGEGAMFLGDDPKQLASNEYQKAPKLTIENLITCIEEESIFSKSDTWELIKTKNSDVFCLQQIDTSMSPTIPANSLIFLEKVPSYIPKKGDLVLVYIKKEQAILIREINNQNNQFFLSPQNHKMFKSIILDKEITIIGKVIECRWNPRS